MTKFYFKYSIQNNLLDDFFIENSICKKKWENQDNFQKMNRNEQQMRNGKLVKHNLFLCTIFLCENNCTYIYIENILKFATF